MHRFADARPTWRGADWRPMKFRLATSLTATAVLMLSLATTAQPAGAAVITMDFTGTVGTRDGELVLGQTGSAIPFSYSITYDTSLGALTAFSAAGTSTVHDFYGYSRAGIVASSLTFGSATWTANDLRPLDITGGGLLVADFFVNTDLTVAAPTLIWSSFRTTQSRLVLGLANATSSGLEMSTRVFITDQGDPRANTLATGDYTMTSSMTPVPEPASLLFVGSGLLGFVARRRLTKKR
jgi:hypothetical protein